LSSFFIGFHPFRSQKHLARLQDGLP